MSDYNFAVDINKFIDNTISREHKIIKEIVTEVIIMPVFESPVDTSNFVNNWMLGLDTDVPSGVNEDLTQNGPADEWEAKQSKAKELVAEIPINAADHNYNLVNNTEYGVELEFGKSREKAPNGMIGVSMAYLPTAIATILAENR